mmetsp:Transcript_130513/g.418477  ORF Transcript_130513/g.418477 Transcript_130513/m.418477 type:complete len:290 (-) Transcript_130513:442-1311(-)
MQHLERRIPVPEALHPPRREWKKASNSSARGWGPDFWHLRQWGPLGRGEAARARGAVGAGGRAAEKLQAACPRPLGRAPEPAAEAPSRARGRTGAEEGGGWRQLVGGCCTGHLRAACSALPSAPWREPHGCPRRRLAPGARVGVARRIEDLQAGAASAPRWRRGRRRGAPRRELVAGPPVLGREIAFLRSAKAIWHLVANHQVVRRGESGRGCRPLAPSHEQQHQESAIDLQGWTRAYRTPPRLHRAREASWKMVPKACQEGSKPGCFVGSRCAMAVALDGLRGGPTGR